MLFTGGTACIGERIMTEETKKSIDEMSQYSMCSLWRFGKSGHPYLTGEVGDYFKDRLFKHHGGFTPEISKSLGH